MSALSVAILLYINNLMHSIKINKNRGDDAMQTQADGWQRSGLGGLHTLMCAAPVFSFPRRLAWWGLGLCLAVSGCTGPGARPSAAALQASFTQGEAAGRQEQTQADQAQIEAALAARQAGFARGKAAGRKAQRRADQVKIAVAQDAVAQAKAASAASPSTADQLAQQAVQETQEIQQITRICHVAPPDISLAPNAPP
jgi:hypothetical protein